MRRSLTMTCYSVLCATWTAPQTVQLHAPDAYELHPTLQTTTLYTKSKGLSNDVQVYTVQFARCTAEMQRLDHVASHRDPPFEWDFTTHANRIVGTKITGTTPTSHLVPTASHASLDALKAHTRHLLGLTSVWLEVPLLCMLHRYSTPVCE